MKRNELQLARDLDLQLEREPRDQEQFAILFRILKGGKVLGRYWTVSGVLEIDGTESRLPDICAALRAFAPAGLRQAA